MMLDEKFLSTLTLLYVEDDKPTRSETYEIFNLLFKEVLVASNGQEALQLYQDTLKNKKRIDVVVSDINMPNKNGMELLKEIRKISNDLPFWFTTAHSDSPNLLSAIEHKVTSYILKPIDIQKLILQIQDYCKNIFIERKFNYEREELNSYLKSIDQVAIISKTDCEGNLTYINDAFLQTTQYEEAELLGQNHKIIRHPDMPKETLSKMWEEAHKGRIWKGKIKSQAKDGTAFYVSTTILPLFDKENEKVIEFIRISFAITKEESEKRDFKKKVISNLQENRRKDNIARKMIDELQEELKKYKHMDLVHETLKKEKEKNDNYVKKLRKYETKLKNIKENYSLVPNDTYKQTEESTE